MKFHAWGGSKNINEYINWVGKRVQKIYGINLKHIKIKDLISDLYIMAMSDMLLSNSKGGFINFARECFNNKDFIKNKFKW